MRRVYIWNVFRSTCVPPSRRQIWRVTFSVPTRLGGGSIDLFPILPNLLRSFARFGTGATRATRGHGCNVCVAQRIELRQHWKRFASIDLSILRHHRKLLHEQFGKDYHSQTCLANYRWRTVVATRADQSKSHSRDSLVANLRGGAPDSDRPRRDEDQETRLTL